MGPKQHQSKRVKREASVYDAVAGRVGYKGFLPAVPSASKYRDTLSSSRVPMPPEEVLFRRRNAPVRYQGQDFYFAHENLPEHCELPASDLLKAIHQYASDYYSRALADRCQCDYRSLDETALIALGILLEETVREALGEAGDLVFTEAEGDGGSGAESKLTQIQVKGCVPRRDSASNAIRKTDETLDVEIRKKRRME